MKKWISLLLCVCMVFGAVSCQPKELDVTESDGARNAVTGPLSDYIVMKENTAYVFRGAEDTFADYVYYVEYASDGYLQRRLVAGDESIAEVFRFTDTSLTLVYSENRFLRHEDLTGREELLSIEWIGAPLKKGAKWTSVDQPSGDISTASVTAVDVEITVPYGTFKTIEVTKTFSDDPDFISKEYYAKGVGLVKEMSISGERVVASELAEVHENVAFNSTIPLFYMEDGERVYEAFEIPYTTNINILETYNSIFPQFFAAKFGVEEALLQITGYVVDYAEYANPVLTLEFTDAFAFISPEPDMIRCMVDTFAYVFGMGEVRFRASGMRLRYNGVEADEEAIMMYTPLPNAEAGDSEADIVDGADAAGE